MYQLKKFSRCCYYFMKELIEFHGSIEIRHVFYFDTVFFIYSILYYLAMSILGFSDYQLQFLFSLCAKDPMCLYVYHHKTQYDPFFPLMVFFMEVFNFYCQTKLVYLKTDTPTWRWWHQLIVQHQDFYTRAKLSKSPKLAKVIDDAKREKLQSSTALLWLLKATTPQFIFEKLILAAFIKVDLFTSLKTINRSLFYRQKLSTLPHISPNLRRRVLLFELLIDQLFFALQVILTLIIVAVYFSYFYPTVGQYSMPYTLVASLIWTFTLAIIYYCLMRLIRSAFFFIYCSLLGTIVYTGHLREVGGQVTKLLEVYCSDTGSSDNSCLNLVLPITYTPLFTHFLHDHNIICRLVLTGSRDLFGDVLFVFLLTNLPINIYLVRRLFFLRQDTIVHVLLYTVISCQLAALTIVFWPLARCQKVFHSPKKWINLFQLKSRGSVRWLRLKLKYDDLFHRLSFGSKMAISIGPISSITFGTALEFIFVYIGYLLMALQKRK